MNWDMAAVTGEHLSRPSNPSPTPYSLFVFGLGYSALHFVRTRRALFASVAGTVRRADKAAELRREGIGAIPFSDDDVDPAIARHLSKTDALLVSIPPGEADPALARFSQAIAAAQDLATIVYLSTIGVYGDHAGNWVDETTTPRPGSTRGHERIRAERGWIELGKRTGKAVHVLRLGGIYGPGRNALTKLREGSARPLAKPGQVFNRVHVEDIARAIEAALAYGGPGGLWNVTDDEPAPPQEVVACAAKLLGLEVPPAVPFEAAEIPAMTRSFYGENRRVANARLKQDLGVRLAFPTYREGLRALFQEGEGRG